MQTKLSNSSSKKTTAEELAKKQREISVSEFFAKNRHLLGFDNPRKALLTTIKEAVDNSLDACEEMHSLPELYVEIGPVKEHPDRYTVIVEDNGPGIVKKQIPNIFGKLLYGSKFHKLSQTRGQQGIGISASALYGQMTTGKGIQIWSKTGPNKPVNYFELHLNTQTNEAVITKDEEVIEDEHWKKKNHGTKILLELEAKYVRGKASVDSYLEQTAIANPHATLIYKAPDAEVIEYKRAVKELPKEPKEIKPHPYGIELGTLIRMLADTNARTLQAFLTSEFSRVSPKVAKEICEKAKLYEGARPKRIARQEADNLMKAIKETKIMAPPTDCVAPIGEMQILKGLQKQVDAEFFAATTRPPSVYRGNPFQIEVGIAYGGDLQGDSLIQLIRFANRVPLLHQQGACGITKAVVSTAWRNYGLQQSKSALPSGPVMLMVHIASVWVPFTSESKEAIAHYPEIQKEIKLALQECGRKLGTYLRKKRKAADEKKKVSYIEKYLPHLGIGIKEILGLSDNKEKELVKILKDTLERSRK